MEQETKLILSRRHMAQIIRRKMTTKVKPSGKTYSRKHRKDYV